VRDESRHARSRVIADLEQSIDPMPGEIEDVPALPPHARWKLVEEDVPRIAGPVVVEHV
jgi:hypothetical protein